MKKNPYALVPGEKYSPSDLLERYLRWIFWYGAHKTLAPRRKCDKQLFKMYACCLVHNKIETERNLFFRHFRKIDANLEYRFTGPQMKYWPKNFCPDFKAFDLIEKFEKHWMESWNDQK